MANSPARSMIEIGSIIDDTYKIEALIGRGGMGAVFLASHERLPGKRVAIKILHTELLDDEILARFKREAQIASQLGHPNIVGVQDFKVDPIHGPFMVLDYLQGQTLAQKLKSGAVPIDQIMSIVRQIASALAAAHREGIVHRDLKPHNIFLVPTEVDGRMIETVKVLDFGISKIRGSTTVKTQESTLLGTPQYMAPEQAMGQHANVDERTDVFALGAIVHEMLCGEPAFSGASIPEVVFKVVYEQPTSLPETVPGPISAAVKQAMAKASKDRFPTVNAFVEDLTGQPLTQMRPSLATIPEGGVPTGSRNITNQDAIANTMGSGDYGTQPHVAPVDPGKPARGSAPTVDSVSRPPSAIELAQTSAPGIEVPAITPPARKPLPTAPTRSTTPLVIGGIIGIAATATIMYFVMRRPDAPVAKNTAEVGVRDPGSATRPPPEPASPPPREATDVKLGSAAPVTAESGSSASAETGSADAGSASTDAGSANVETGSASTDAGSANVETGSAGSAASAGGAASGAGPRKPPKTVTPPKDDPPSSVDPDDVAGLRDALAKGQAALANGNWGAAKRHANSVINRADGTNLADEAHFIRGSAYCKGDNDVERARIDLRALRGRPKLRGMLVLNCSGHL